MSNMLLTTSEEEVSNASYDATSVTAEPYPPTTIRSWLGRTATRGLARGVGISPKTLHEFVPLL